MFFLSGLVTVAYVYCCYFHLHVSFILRFGGCVEHVVDPLFKNCPPEIVLDTMQQPLATFFTMACNRLTSDWEIYLEEEIRFFVSVHFQLTSRDMLMMAPVETYAVRVLGGCAGERVLRALQRVHDM